MSDQPSIPDYQIHLPPLGEGAFGTVYRATYRGISDRALKLFKPDKVDLTAMARELEKLSSVAEHHGIVTLHDFDLLGQTPHYAMGLHADKGDDEQWQTRTLEQVCGRIDAREGWRMLREIAEAVAYLHRHHIIHCDLKPSNILLTDENPQRVKICDFGQSRGDRFDVDDTAGTPLYAGPDQLRTPSDSADGKGFRWDVYSFGVVAFKLLTGQLPRLQSLADMENPSVDLEATIADNSLEATIADSDTIDNRQLADLIESEPNVQWPPWLRMPTERRELIERCLSLDPNERYADMREVHAAMEQVDQQSRVRRSTRLNAVFAVLLVVAIWASGFASVQARRAKAATEAAMTSRDQARDLVLLVADKLSRELTQSGQEELISYVSENTEPFLENLEDDKRASRTLLQFSARSATIRGDRAEDDGDYELALSSYRSAYEIHSQLAASSPEDDRMRREAASDLMQVGRIALQLADFDAALESFETALGIHEASLGARAIPEPEQLNLLTLSLESIADTALVAEQPERAVSALQRAIDLHVAVLRSPTSRSIATASSLADRLAELQINLGNLHLAAEEFESAEAVFLKCYQQISKPGNELLPVTEEPELRIIVSDPQLVADTLSGLGRVRLQLELSESALNIFNEELKIRRREVDRHPLEADTRLALARAYSNVAACFDLAEPRTRDLALTSLERSIAEVRQLPYSVRESETVIAFVEESEASIDAILELNE